MPSSEKILHSCLFFFNPNNICLFSKCKIEQKKIPGIAMPAALRPTELSTSVFHRPRIKVNWEGQCAEVVRQDTAQVSWVGGSSSFIPWKVLDHSRKQSHSTSQSRTDTCSHEQLFCAYAGQLYLSQAD